MSEEKEVSPENEELSGEELESVSGGSGTWDGGIKPTAVNGPRAVLTPTKK